VGPKEGVWQSTIGWANDSTLVNDQGRLAHGNELDTVAWKINNNGEELLGGDRSAFSEKDFM